MNDIELATTQTDLASMRWARGVDLTGSTYRRLIHASKGGFALFVVRPNRQANWLKKFEESVGGGQVLRDQGHSWPATQYCSIPVERSIMAISPIVVEWMLKPDALWKWQPPEYPEDLALCTPDLNVWFCSTTHESEWFVNLDIAPQSLQGEFKQLQAVSNPF